MKKLSILIAAGLFVVAFAQAASASCQGWSSNSLDPAGYSMITVQAPSHHETAEVSHNVIYLDSNHLWAVQNPTYRTEAFAAGKAPARNLVCFDSTSKFCAIE